MPWSAPALWFIGTRRPNSLCTTTVTRLRRSGPRSVRNADSEAVTAVSRASSSATSSVWVSKLPTSTVATMRPTSARRIVARSDSAADSMFCG